MAARSPVRDLFCSRFHLPVRPLGLGIVLWIERLGDLADIFRRMEEIDQLPLRVLLKEPPVIGRTATLLIARTEAKTATESPGLGPKREHAVADLNPPGFADTQTMTGATP